MAATQLRGAQVLDASIQYQDLDASTVGKSVVKKIVQPVNSIIVTGNGADAGTGDVTISLGTTIYIGSKARLTALANGLRLEVQDSGLNWIIQQEWTE